MSGAGEDPRAPLSGGIACPVPYDDEERVTLSHGAGAGASARLFEEIVFPAFDNGALAERHDGAVLDIAGARLAFTTDSYVVRPIFFPGGDIGSLAVNGTVNDLAMCGARPLALSCGLVLEEGFPLAMLRRVVRSLGAAASAAGVSVVTGDTKVVERGKGDGVFINTAGVGLVPNGRDLRPARVGAGDVILLSGTIAEHGAAVLCSREGIELESEIESDCAALHGLVEAMMEAAPTTHCLRDPTRGGLGAVLHEISHASGTEITLDESRVPVSESVHVACELLGLDPLFLACEGRLVAFVPASEADAALAALLAHPLGAGATQIGVVGAADRSRVVVQTRAGGRRLLDRPAGEPLPRIC